MSTDFRAAWLQDMQERFQSLKDLGDRAIAQVSDGEFFHQLDGESNSIAVLLQHMGGNLRSRWTDFLTTDGEKPDRNRDGEFVIEPGTRRSDVVARWEEGWRCVFDTFSALRPEDIEKMVRVRGEPHSVPQAIHRQVTHAAYHVGQIVFLAKHYRSSEWNTLTIPRGGTEAFNRALAAKYGAKA
jgi:hypothetical protein